MSLDRRQRESVWSRRTAVLRAIVAEIESPCLEDATVASNGRTRDDLLDVLAESDFDHRTTLRDTLQDLH